MGSCHQRIRPLSQNELAKELGTNHSVIGKYERDDVKPSIEVVKKIAQILETTVAFLARESEDGFIFEDKKMLQRLKDLLSLPEKDKEAILYNLDALLRDAKTRQAYK